MLDQERPRAPLAEAARLENFALRRCLSLSVAFAWTLLAAAALGAGSSSNGMPEPPSVEFGELYQAVEMDGLFPDQKTFADTIPDKPPAQLWPTTSGRGANRAST
jgi:hypothetical protein